MPSGVDSGGSPGDRATLSGPLPGGKDSKVRQTIRFLDDHRFQWTVALQKGDEWTQIIDATWKRKGK